jgi:tRNA-specific 2-thiouridylase
MSGGVDSSVSLILLKKSGWQPVGVTLLLPKWGSCADNACCTKESLAIAKKVCKKLGVKHYAIDCRKEFKRTVMDYFVSELRAGRTPNPCITCNRFFKFKTLFDLAKKHGIDFVATGHYAKIKHTKGKALLVRPKDKLKNQTYGLCLLPQEWLQHIVFPLADLTKTGVYEIASRGGFPVFLKRKQSQDLCFVSSSELQKFIDSEVGGKKGAIVDENGNAVGKHAGLPLYTIGQRKGLGGFFVKSKNAEKNELVVTKNRSSLNTKIVFVRDYNFSSGEIPKRKLKVKAQVRYRQEPVEATLYPPKNKTLKIVFKKPVEAAASGQIASFYAKGVCLGGGYIA